MAGMGSRFAQAGYAKPKPFIDVDGEPMIVRVMRNLYYPGARYILIGRESHLEQEHELVRSIAAEYNAHFIGIEKLTEGTACTVLFAREFINTEHAKIGDRKSVSLPIGRLQFFIFCFLCIVLYLCTDL